jgi:two-component system, response regulator YesN
MPSLLVVDDTPTTRSTIVQVVSRDTKLSPVFQATNGAEAITSARRHWPDVILMDLKMPGIDGIQASATIRAEQPRTRIIILSAYDEFSAVQSALKLGAVGYLLKPISPTRLVDTLDQVCAELLVERLPPEPTSSDEQGGGAPPPHEGSSLISLHLIQQALDHVRQNHQRPDTSPGDVSQTPDLALVNLPSALNDQDGAPITLPITSLRIEAAKRLLRHTNMTINAICERVGYINATNFYRLFNRETGMTPAEFRRQSWGA